MIPHSYLHGVGLLGHTGGCERSQLARLDRCPTKRAPQFQAQSFAVSAFGQSMRGCLTAKVASNPGAQISPHFPHWSRQVRDTCNSLPSRRHRLKGSGPISSSEDRLLLCASFELACSPCRTHNRIASGSFLNLSLSSCTIWIEQVFGSSTGTRPLSGSSNAAVLCSSRSGRSSSHKTRSASTVTGIGGSSSAILRTRRVGHQTPGWNTQASRESLEPQRAQLPTSVHPHPGHEALATGTFVIPHCGHTQLLCALVGVCFPRTHPHRCRCSGVCRLGGAPTEYPLIVGFTSELSE